VPPGPHPFGGGRIGCWFIPSQNFSDKLRHRLPLVKPLGVTDIFLPRQATKADKQLVRDAGYFAALYETPPSGMSPVEYATQALEDIYDLAISTLELNIEGIPDHLLSAYVRAVVVEIRKPKPHLRLRVNVVPWKGAYLPSDLFASDKQLYVIVQAYLGNVDVRVAEDEIVRDLVGNGIPDGRCSVMYGAHVGQPRVPSLPQIRYRGSIYQDDLLADGGYL